MNLSGVLVRSLPENVGSVSSRLESLAGVEVHGANADGRLVVTVEATGDHAMADAVVRIMDLPGVLSASMIYHHYEEESDPEEALR